jgi:acetylornithine/succinyldiaminopimelate/putrescine aminotransferase
MPLGAFIADKKIMDSLTHNPVLGHINTFGGHPVSCAAGLAGFKVLMQEDLIADVANREALFRSLLHHPLINEVNSHGLMMAVEFENFETNKRVIDALITEGILPIGFICSTCIAYRATIKYPGRRDQVACKKMIDVLNKIAPKTNTDLCTNSRDYF